MLEPILLDLLEGRPGQTALTVDQLRLAQIELERAEAEPHATGGGRGTRRTASQPDADGCDLKPDPATAGRPQT